MARVPESVATFLRGRRLAVAGVSRDSHQPANAIFRKLKGAGYEVFPINPRATTVEGTACYADLAAVPCRSMASSSSRLRARHWNRPPMRRARRARVWFHRSFGDGSVSNEAVSECAAKGIDAIVGGCPMMFCEPVDSGQSA